MKLFDIKLLIKLLQYVKPYKLLFIGTILVSVLFGVISTIRPLLIQYAFDNYIIINDIKGLFNIIILILLLLFLEVFCQFVFIYQSNYLAQTIIKNIRVELFAKIMTFNVRYFDNVPTGQLITRSISDMEAISSVFSQGLLVVFGDIFKMLLVILCMFVVSWELAAISLIFLPVLIFATIIFQKYMRRAFVDVRKYISKINVVVYEYIRGMHIVQIFSKENDAYLKFKKLNTLHRDAHVKTVFYFSIFLPFVDVFSAIAMGLLVWYGTLNIISSGDITIGQIIAFILFINMLFRPLRAIADRFNVLQMGAVAASRVFDILEKKSKSSIHKNSQLDHTKMSGNIEFKNISFSYKENEKVLKGINFNVQKNTTLAIVGPTGSGKTTIINLIMKWYNPDSGSIFFDETNISDLSINTIRGNIGVVLQDSFFLSDTLMNNIKFFNNISDEDVYQAVNQIGLQDFINKLPNKYNYYIGERGSGLSEGEKQLVSFLRTYLLNPSYLILDEATSSMDPLTENLIQNSIKNLTHNRTSIIIAHRLSTIQNADNIIVLENGSIIECGSHNSLIKLNGKYAKYYCQQFITH